MRQPFRRMTLALNALALSTGFLTSQITSAVPQRHQLQQQHSVPPVIPKHRSSTHHAAVRENNYIHEDDNIIRQDLLQTCFGGSSKSAFHISGVMKRIQEQLQKGGAVSILEIGCGAGKTTLDLAEWIRELQLPSSSPIKIVGIDVSQDLIDAAQRRLEKAVVAASSSACAIEVQFKCMSGEDASRLYADQFDAVWMRFVVVHVRDPQSLIQAATKCLQPADSHSSGGILLIEDCDATGAVASPPWYVHELFHKAHAETSLQLGGDISRGPHIGGYIRESGLVNNIQCNAFVPMFARGVEIFDNTEHQAADDDNHPNDTNLDDRFMAGAKLLEMSFDSLTPKFLEFKICTQEEIDEARQSLREVLPLDDANTEDERPYQIFSLPGGKVFQWWATRDTSASTSS